MNVFQQHFVETAKKYGQKPAFVDRSAEKRITYSKALVSSLLLAGKFRKYPPGFLGIMLPTSAACALVFLAALMSGRTPVMINYSMMAAKNAGFAQRRCRFTTIITSRTFLEKIGCPYVEGMVFLEDIINGISLSDKLLAALVSKLPVSAILKQIHLGSAEDVIVILFTSGSEKEPKAVQLTHRNVISNISAFSEVTGISDQDKIMANLPFFHVFGLTVNMLTPLSHGMTAVSFANPLEYRKICEIVKEERPTLMVGTPSFLWGYLRKSEPGDFASLRLMFCGADKCPDALRLAFLERHGVTIYEGYGTTETSPVISVNLPGQNKPGSVGRILPGVVVRIENYESGDDCVQGQTGRIMVQGDLVMKGYYDDLEETSMRIRHGWYDTGDMGYMDEDGYLWHAGRLKRFVKVGGEMISLVSVENVLERVLPDGVECCVVEVPDLVKGARVVAAVTTSVDERDLINKMSRELPNLALPKQFVVMEELPKMGSGKIDFRRVTDIVRELVQAKR